jgi:hypothetical protein
MARTEVPQPLSAALSAAVVAEIGTCNSRCPVWCHFCLVANLASTLATAQNGPKPSRRGLGGSARLGSQRSRSLHQRRDGTEHRLSRHGTSSLWPGLPFGSTAISGARLIDEILLLLKSCGWSIGDTAFGEGPERIWLVFGSNGESTVKVEGTSRAIAWWKALLRANATGMCGAPNGGCHENSES